MSIPIYVFTVVIPCSQMHSRIVKEIIWDSENLPPLLFLLTLFSPLSLLFLLLLFLTTWWLIPIEHYVPIAVPGILLTRAHLSISTVPWRDVVISLIRKPKRQKNWVFYTNQTIRTVGEAKFQPSLLQAPFCTVLSLGKSRRLRKGSIQNGTSIGCSIFLSKFINLPEPQFPHK